MFGVSPLSSWSLGIRDLPADTYPLPTGPARSRRPPSGATVGAARRLGGGAGAGG